MKHQSQTSTEIIEDEIDSFMKKLSEIKLFEEKSFEEKSFEEKSFEENSFEEITTTKKKIIVRRIKKNKFY
jgi:hypothetical protein